MTSIHWADGTNNLKVFSPDSEPYGFTLEEWAAKSWQRIFSMSSASDGRQDEGDADNSCAINQGGPVWHLGGSTGEGGSKKSVCTIPMGKAFLYPVLTGACTYADTPNAKSDTELRSCAMSGDEGALIEMSIDGIKLEDINRYRVQSSPFDVVIPEGNVFGISPGPTRGVADCWCVMIEHLPVGRHVIKHTVSIPGNPTIGISAFAAETTYDLIVQEQQFAVTPYAISVAGSEDERVLPINSSSNVSDFRFNEQTKQISFKVSSEDDNVGIVMLPVSRALEGPYTVTFDGTVMTNFAIINNHTSNETSIEISHNPGIHDIAVMGTTVIPEFPTSLVSVLILGVAIGVIVTLSRRQYLICNHQQHL
jgi:predicted secreted protein with PEFG-CTERM motif